MTIFEAKKGRGVFFVLGGVKVPRVIYADKDSRFWA
jgi:hypothetical protein